MRTRFMLSVLVLFALLASCNLPGGQVPNTGPSESSRVSSDVDTIGTAVELTAAARLTQIAGSVTPTATVLPTVTLAPTSSVPTACSPLVTATVIANVRAGPATAYDIVGSLSIGQSATVVGRNDAYTWWYIDYPAGSGAHAWIAGSVVTASCVPAVVQVVAAPPLPTATAVEVADNSSDDSSGGSNNGDSNVPLGPLVPLQPLHPVLLRPDLVASSMQVSPSPATKGSPISVQVKIKNTGNAAAGNFVVQWRSSPSVVACSWLMGGLAAGASQNLSCTYTYNSWSTYTIKLMVDPQNAVAEANEGNNVLEAPLVVKSH